MPEPTSTAVAVSGPAAAITAATLAYLGVDYYALIWAFIGVIGTVSSIKPTSSRAGLAAAVVVATLIAAGLGQGFVSLANVTARPVLMLVSLLCGIGGQVVAQAAVEALIARIKQVGGQ